MNSLPPTLAVAIQQAMQADSRFLGERDLAALDKATDAWNLVLRHPALAVAPEPVQLHVMQSAGMAYLHHYQACGQAADLEAALGLWRTVLDRTPVDAPERPGGLSNVSHVLNLRYGHFGRLEDLDEAIRLAHEAVACTPHDAPYRSGYLTNLGNALHDRYVRLRQLIDLEEAIAVYRDAVTLASRDWPAYPGYLTNLGAALQDRYLQSGRLDDLEEAIRIGQQAVDATSPDSPDRPGFLINLGSALRERYTRASRIEDLEATIDCYQQALAQLPPESPACADALSGLCASLSARYTRTGRREDLDTVTRLAREGLRLTPPDSPYIAGHLTNLGSGLRDRYARTGSLDDLEEAIQCYRQALQHTPPDSARRPMRLNNLGHALRERALRTGRPDDLQEAVAVGTEAVADTPSDSPELPIRLNNLGNALRTYYASTQDLLVLRQTIQAYHWAVKRVDPNSPYLAMYLANLGTGLYDRYVYTRDIRWLRLAIRAYRRAVRYTSCDAPALANYLTNLAAGLRDLHTASHLRSPGRVTQVYRIAARLGLARNSEAALTAARAWGDWAWKRGAWAEAAEAYGMAATAMDRLYRTQLLRQNKAFWLQEAQGMPARAAYALVQSSQLHEAAAVIEQTRARLLNEALDRADVQRLQQTHPDLFSRFEQAASRVAELESWGRDEVVEGRDEALQEARRMLDVTLEEIRQIQGYEQLMRPPADLSSVAGDSAAAVVYVMATDAGGLALAVRGEQVQALRLGLSTLHLESIMFTQGDEHDRRFLAGAILGDQEALQHTLEWALPLLGERMLEPLAMLLRSMACDQVALVPIGLLSLLPLHAASYQVGEHRIAFLDEFTVTYAPSARALAAARHAAHQRVAAPLLVSVGNPLPERATLAVLQDRLRSSLKTLPPDLHNSADWRRLDRLLQLPLEELIDEGYALRRLAYRLAAEVGPLAQDLSALAGRWPITLRYANAEVRSIAGLLPPDAARPLYGQAATHAALRQSLPGATLLHLACHAEFRADDPLASGADLAAGDRLTLQELITADFHGLDAARLVVLSACQTAVTDFRDLPDEAIGLPAGFLQAGVPAVVGTLWNVDDASTALFMTRFYELMLHEQRSPVDALRQTQRWLRDLTAAELEQYLEQDDGPAASTLGAGRQIPPALLQELLTTAVTCATPQEQPYAHPYYWAAFTIHGFGTSLL